MLDLEAIRRRWWLNDADAYSETLRVYSGLLWGADDVRDLIDEVERLRTELARLRERSVPLDSEDVP